ncbi:penicillin-binding protein 2 [Cellulomonas sp. NPDC089187]|uniref:peptidoglycan D,D-transpeptidase FtsI family protein n=1 Tax=Cellulomonas sp. NPDC089187 TaxID=3154970 RepID=UPI00341640BE
MSTQPGRNANRSARTPRPTQRPHAPIRDRVGPRMANLSQRRSVLVVLVAGLLTVFAGRLIYVQGVAGDAIAAEAKASRMTTSQLIAQRGEITDTNGVVLATSVTRYNIAVNQKQLATWSTVKDGTTLSGAAGAAELLSPILDISAAELGATLQGDAGFRYVAKGVLPEVWQAVREYRINGISAEQVAERVYPNGNTAGNVLGWVNGDGVGAESIERLMNDELAGVDGQTEYERGRGGQLIPGGYEDTVAAQDGRNLQLTISTDLQFRAQQAIEQQVATTGADSGSIVALNVKTGEILVLAESATVDPNNPGVDQSLLVGSKSVTNVFEPGSTAKVITMAAAIETGVTDPLGQFTVNDRYTTSNGQTFKDSHDHAPQRLTTTGVLAQSSNTGTVMIGQNIPEETRYDYLHRFGFGQKTGIELPSEAAGNLKAAEDWDGRTKYAVLFGQGLSVTALQATEVFATIANDGVRIAPHLVKGWSDDDGTFTPAEPAEQTQVVSPETAQTVLTMMESAVDEGTGSTAAIPGYRVAGKTGTAQNWDQNGNQGITSSFIGVAPADDPAIAVSVVLHNPRTSEWGGTVAGPVFSQIAGYALTELGVAPSGAPAQLFPTEW